jgi:hypothetical protein
VGAAIGQILGFAVMMVFLILGAKVLGDGISTSAAKCHRSHTPGRVVSTPGSPAW